MYFWLWIAVLIGALVLEIVTLTNLVSIWFCVGAVFALIANALKLNFLVQTLIFFAVSFLFMAVIRPMAKEYLRGNVVATNADRLIGQHCRLRKAIATEEWGEVRIHGLTWGAVSYNGEAIRENTLIEIMAIEGSKLIVKPIE